MNGRLVPSKRYTHTCTPPPPITPDISDGDRWECDECTAYWVAFTHGTLQVGSGTEPRWSSSPHAAQRRGPIDRWLRRHRPPSSRPPARGLDSLAVPPPTPTKAAQDCQHQLTAQVRSRASGNGYTLCLHCGFKLPHGWTYTALR